jgi:DNA replication and repair protein RecF
MISDIRLQHFRSYSDDSFEFDPGVNIIVGPNASGKTNLLEAILCVCLGNSYRAKDIELIRHGQPWARLDGHTENHKRTIKLVRHEELVQKDFVIDQQKLKRLSLQKSVPVVLFEPNHLLLFHGGKELRRDYLDALLEQLVPGYATLRRQYRRALAQRNALLKQEHARDVQLFAWNIRLSELGGQIANHRQTLVKRIDKKFGKLYKNLSHSKIKATLAYTSTCSLEQYSSDLLHKLEQSQERDIARGFTGYGPHRDDLVVHMDSKPASETASRGETRTLLLVLKILELELLEESRGIKPILLLDDVFSELDGARRKALTEVIAGYQSFITTTDADVVVQHFMTACNIIPTTNSG